MVVSTKLGKKLQKKNHIPTFFAANKSEHQPNFTETSFPFSNQPNIAGKLEDSLHNIINLTNSEFQLGEAEELS